MPRIDKPASGTSIMDSRTCSNTLSGNAPGPPEKFRLLCGFICRWVFMSHSGRHPGRCAGSQAKKKIPECLLNFPHMELFVGKQVFRIHGMHDHGVVDFEHQKLPLSGFRTIDTEIIDRKSTRLNSS